MGTVLYVCGHVPYVPSVSSSFVWCSEMYGGYLVNYNVLKLLKFESNFQQIVTKYSFVIIHWSTETSQHFKLLITLSL
jgi:hypothetical protein